MDNRPQKPFEEAYMNYIRALQEAWTPQHAQKQFEDAHLDYIRGVLEAQTSGDTMRRFEADLAYMRALQLPDEAHQRFDEAYRTYLRAVQDAWAQLDIKSLDAETLAAIGQSLLAAASCAAKHVPRAAQGQSAQFHPLIAS